MRKPKLLTKCVANSYVGRSERIAEFSNGEGVGGLFRLLHLPERTDGARLLAELYRCNDAVLVRCDPARLDMGLSDADGLLRAAERAKGPAPREHAELHAPRLTAMLDCIAALRTAFDFVAKHSPMNPYSSEPGRTIAAALAAFDKTGG